MILYCFSVTKLQKYRHTALYNLKYKPKFEKLILKNEIQKPLYILSVYTLISLQAYTKLNEG